MITNSKIIISTLKFLVDEIKEKFPKFLTVQLSIGVRFDDDGLHKEPCLAKDLVSIVWSFIDCSHPLYKSQLKGKRPNSIFIQDAAGAVLFESAQYVPRNDKIKLKHDKNTRVKEFKNLSQLDKGRVIEILAEQIKTTKSEDLDIKEEKNEWDSLGWL